jgi:hypothetical protein
MNHIHTHAQRKYSEYTTPSYYETNTDHCNCCSTPSSLGSHEPNRQRTKRLSVYKHTQRNVYKPYQWRVSPLFKCMLSTRLPEDYVFMKTSLNNYDGLANPKEHVQNMHNNLELIFQDCDSICKIFHTTFRHIKT